MKKLFLIISILLTAVVVNAQSKNGKFKEVTIKTSAQCDMCKSRIEKEMTYEKGVKKAELTVDTKILTVTYDTTKTDVAKIKAAVVKTGYDADELQGEAKAYEKLPACCKKDGGH